MKIIAQIRGKSGTASDIRAALANIDLVALETKVEELEAERRTILLDGTDAQVAAIEKRIATANLACERAHAIKAELESRLEQVASAEVEQSRVDAYATAKAKSEAAAKLLAREYPQIGEKLRMLIRVIAEADQAVATANAALPAGAEPLLGPEMKVRGFPSIPEETISEVVEHLWCHANRADLVLVPPQMQKDLDREANGRDEVNRASGGHFRKRTLIRRTFIPAMQIARPRLLAATSALPGLAVNDPPYWPGIDSREAVIGAGHRTVLAKLASLDERKPAHGRKRPDPKVEYFLAEDGE